MRKKIKFLAESPEYLLALANACLFLLLSIGGLIIQLDSLVFALLPSLIFLMGSLISWIFMMKRGWALTPIGWFVLGTGLFFGFGVFAGGLHVHPWTDYLYGNDVRYLTQVNTLNAVSVSLVLFTASWFIRSPADIDGHRENALGEVVAQSVPLRFFLCFCFLIAVLKLIFFPDVGNLVLRSLLAKVYFFFPAIFLLSGIVMRQMRWVDRLLFALIFILQLANGALLCNKYEVLMPIIALMIGMWASSKSYKWILGMLAVPVMVFWFANPLVSLARSHHDYNATENSLHDRVWILWDVFNSTYFAPKPTLGPAGGSYDNTAPTEVSSLDRAATHTSSNVAPRMALYEKVRAVGVRFDVASIEGFLIKEYDEGRPGKSLEDFWSVFIPRVFWPEKPIVTRFGNELNYLYYKQTFSAIAPTYSAEAYWNYGWIGVFLVSIYLGIVFGIFTQISLNAARGADVAYLFVAYPLLVSAAFVESWITATYIGGIAIIILYYIAIKAALSLIARGKKSA